MDPHNPVDPDDVLAQETTGQSAANRSDVETPTDIQSTSAEEPPPVDDTFELNNDLKRIDLDSIPLPAAGEATATNAGSTSSDSAAMTSSNNAMPDPPPPSRSTVLASPSADSGLDVEHVPAIETVEAIPPDVIQRPGNKISDSSADLAVPQDDWPEAHIDLPAVATQSSQLSFDLGNAGARAATAPMDSIAEYVRPVADPNASHERTRDGGGKQGDEPAGDAKIAPSDPQPEPAPVEQKEDANLREEIDRFIEKFNEQSARTHALLSPAFDGGPPMARPIVLVSLAAEQMQGITNEVLAESGSRLAKTASEVAEDKVNEAFWLRDCEMRALYRGR